MAKSSPFELQMAKLIAKHLKDIKIPVPPVPPPKTAKKKGKRKPTKPGGPTKLVGPAVRAIAKRLKKKKK